MTLKFKEPQVIRATYRIVTPMFIGDADQNTTDGVRPPSVKGALRFWWRALNWSRFADLGGTNALNALNVEEARLFGSAMNREKSNVGQGVFLLSVEQDLNAQEKIFNWPPDKSPNNGASFMAYGLLETQDDPHRGALSEGAEFTVKLVFNPNKAKEGDLEQMEKTLESWSLFGGLGGRSRRGMGSVTQILLNGKSVLMTKTDYQERVQTLLKEMSSVALAPYTAFSADSFHRAIDSGRNARSTIEKTGERYKDFRSRLKGQSFAKAGFGLPLKDFNESQRRASPLLFHVHELENASFTSALIYLPSSQFHPDSSLDGVSFDKVAEFARGAAV